MPTVTIQIPPEHRDELVRELLSLYSVKTDALLHAVGDYLGHEHSPTALLAHRAELASMDALLEQLGWGLHDPPRPAQLTGDSHLLAEITRGALNSALDDMTDTLSGTIASAQEIEAVGRTLRRVSVLYELIHAAYRLADERSV